MMVTSELTAAAESSALSLAAGRAGSLGVWQVGASAVYIEPLRAQIVLWSNAAGATWESTQIVSPGQTVFAGDAFYRVQMAPGATGGSIAFTRLAAPPGAAVPSDAVILAAGGQLRVDGPDTAAATDIRILRWLPDEQHPTAAEVEVWPAKWGRAGTRPEDFRQVELAADGHAVFGRTAAAVIGLQGASADHPGWIVLRLSRAE